MTESKTYLINQPHFFEYLRNLYLLQKYLDLPQLVLIIPYLNNRMN